MRKSARGDTKTGNEKKVTRNYGHWEQERKARKELWRLEVLSVRASAEERARNSISITVETTKMLAGKF